jgi:hypothetical protein
LLRVPSPTPAPVSASPFRNGNPRTSPVGEKLNAEESTAIRAQLIQEIETLPEVDPQPRAIAILKTKNRLSADDAKLVEEAFAARMALQGVCDSKVPHGRRRQRFPSVHSLGI